MRPFRAPLSYSALTVLLCIFLIGAGVSRYIETDSGNILIHDIQAESYENFPYGARLYRPLQASSMNQRPSVLLIPGLTADRYTCDHVAMELARRGFAALAIEDFDQGTTASEPDYYTENLVDAGFTFLSTRSFTDHSRIGLAVFYDGAAKALEAKKFDSFASRIFVSPPSEVSKNIPENDLILTAQYETDPRFRIEEASETLAVTHAGMLIAASVIQTLLEKFHEDLTIPNDSPFWFDAGAQKAQPLIFLRSALLIILMGMTSGLGGRILAGAGHPVWKATAGIFIPLLVFHLIAEIMNFFPISVRLGSPFHYLPTLFVIQKRFSLPVLLVFLLFSLIAGIRLGSQRRSVFLADIIAAAGFLLCLADFLPVLSGSHSGWEFMGIMHIQWGIVLITLLSAVSSVLLRLSDRRRISLVCVSVINGVMSYSICCGLPFAALFQEV